MSSLPSNCNSVVWNTTYEYVIVRHRLDCATKQHLRLFGVPSSRCARHDVCIGQATRIVGVVSCHGMLSRFTSSHVTSRRVTSRHVMSSHEAKENPDEEDEHDEHLDDDATIAAHYLVVPDKKHSEKDE